MSPPQQQAAPSGGRLKQKIIAKKKEEMKDYMGGVKKVIEMYVPPDPERMQQAFQAKKASWHAGSGSGAAEVVFLDYAQPGDSMTMSFDTAAKKIKALNVKSYMDDPKDTVTLTVTFASLPDGTNYVQQSVLGASAKHLVATTTSSDYHPLAAQ